MRQENVRNIEDYIYDHKDRKIVIVGSSFAARLKPSMLGTAYWNLAQQGGTSLTGLEIILKSKAKPDIVVIELNVINYIAGRFIRSIFNPVLYSIRKILPCFREKYSPTNLLLNFLRLHIVRSEKEKRESTIRKQKIEMEANHLLSKDSFFRNAIGLYKKKYYSAVREMNDILQLEATQYWSLLIRQIQMLADRGITVVFLVMPASTANTADNIVKINYFLERYPDSKFCWLYYGIGNRYQTLADGLHLTYSSGWDFSRELRRRVEDLYNQNKRCGAFEGYFRKRA